MEDLFQGEFGVPLHSQVIDNEQAVTVHAVDERIPVLRVHTCQCIEDPGKIRHQYGNAFIQKCIGNTTCKEGLSGSDISPEKKTGRPFFHVVPVFHIFMGKRHLRIDSAVFGKGIIIECLILQATGFHPLDLHLFFLKFSFGFFLLIEFLLASASDGRQEYPVL